MSNLLNTALDFMGFLDAEENEVYKQETNSKKNNKSLVSMLPKTSQPTIIHSSPKAFEDVIDIAKRLQDRKIVTINLSLVGEELSIRIIDFVSGAVYALDGEIMKLADNVYLLAGQGVILQER